ncbi:hypothetical protein K431DRAFT_282484 [Polychaeton citri CBS 116435]|uniref:Zn(2)-C6 fungal-type domain-containing protein n=1 Tax=Polychaeton citri CBS 116435 TaxID=1314669 RepID=A0A9P4QDB2_9PEZI|nr:hypothetical protein K431DRAFT_282484 [Polychaeton citri CBS 116435]
MDSVAAPPSAKTGTDVRKSFDAASAADNVTTGGVKPKIAHGQQPSPASRAAQTTTTAKAKPRRRRKNATQDEEDASKRRCVSTACVACRKRKSKCDGNTPACAACSQVYGTECVYDPNSDHRRKGVYKNDLDNLKTRNSTLHTLIQAILNYAEEDVPALVHEIRTCESLDEVAEGIVAKEQGLDPDDDDDDLLQEGTVSATQTPTFETQLYGKMGDLRLDDGSMRYIGGTSNLIHLGNDDASLSDPDEYTQQEDPITSWTAVTDDAELVVHLLNMYFTWHYTYFTTLSKSLFYRDFLLGRPPPHAKRKTQYCTPLLVNAILALGCHFTSHGGAREVTDDSATAGDHFFREAKRLIKENDEHEKPRLTTVQALALMSVREAGCGREAKGWVYSGMSFRMACDMGLNIDSGQLSTNKNQSPDEAEEDCRRITFWGCYLFDKCWSNYLGRLPQLPTSLVTVPKAEVFLDEEASQWSPYTDSGFSQAHAQPARTRAVALQITNLCEISNDLMRYFYNPLDMEKTKGKQVELKKLSEMHTRLEAWRRELPKELEPKEGGLSSVIVMHMFFQLLFIHLFRPFLKYTQATSPLPANVSPRKLCTQAAATISKLLRLYKRSHGLRQICNIAVYIAHSACTIHLLNLPDKNARRDIIHGVKHLEEIAEGWLCARRTLSVLSTLARKWNIDLPEEAATVLARAEVKFGQFQSSESLSPSSQRRPSEVSVTPQFASVQLWPNNLPQAQQPVQNNFMNTMQHVPGYAQNPNQLNRPIHYSNSAGGPATAPVRSSLVNRGDYHFSLPPQNADDLRAQQYPSHVTTPAHTVSDDQSRSHQRSPGTSPSDMFGGVEQLIRENMDWVYKDQAQIASGFDNWTGGMEGMDHWSNGHAVSPVASGGGVISAAPPPSVRNAPVPANIQGGYGIPNGLDNGVGVGTGIGSVNTVANGYPMMDGMQGIFNGSVAAYNEDEWYQ